MKIFFDEIDHFHPNFDESVPNPGGEEGPKKSQNVIRGKTAQTQQTDSRNRCTAKCLEWWNRLSMGHDNGDDVETSN